MAPDLLEFERNKRSIPMPLVVNPRWLQSDEGFRLLSYPYILYTGWIKIDSYTVHGREKGKQSNERNKQIHR